MSGDGVIGLARIPSSPTGEVVAAATGGGFFYYSLLLASYPVERPLHLG